MMRPDSSCTSTGSSKHIFAAFNTEAGIRTEALLPLFLHDARACSLCLRCGYHCIRAAPVGIQIAMPFKESEANNERHLKEELLMKFIGDFC